ncbi:MAG: protein kinase [Clostridia bacterium]|nr:protein kinase [Clostridia bacterium]
MECMLENDTELVSESGNRYRVLSMIGAGGQGEVYKAELNGRLYALKWYYPETATQTQWRILEALIAKGAPDATFLWPLEGIRGKTGGSYGYIMPLRPERFKGVVQMMKRQAEPSFATLCRAAYNLTKGYERLHKEGWSYRDISFGNVMFDPDNGDIMICDNDNASPNDRKEDIAVYGTPRFMAPEIVTGKAMPSRNTDIYSLSVLLFYMFMLGHPLDGELEAKVHCMDPRAMYRLYGTNPVFVFDPADKSNRPVKGLHDNVLIYWDIYPQVIRDLFTRAFTEGLTQPNRRVTESEWMDAFANLMTGIIPCPSCGAEVFFDENKTAMGVPHVCWKCGRSLQYPVSLVSGKTRVLLNRDATIRSHNIREDYDMDTVVGHVVRNPANPQLWGIENDSDANWTYIRADGRQVPVAPGRRVGIVRGARIDFGPLTGEYR